MSEKEQPVFLKCFGRIEDPRLDRQKRHKLVDLITMAVCATIAGAVHDDVFKITDPVRAHWGIENGLHWVLNVAFLEDQSRIRLGYAAENIAAIRKIANNALRQCTSRKGGVKNKRLQAGWDNRFMEEIIMAL